MHCQITHWIFFKSKAVSNKSCVENFIANCHHMQKYKIEIPTKCPILKLFINFIDEVCFGWLPSLGTMKMHVERIPDTVYKIITFTQHNRLMHTLPFHKQCLVFSIHVNLYQFNFLLYQLSSFNLKTYDLENFPTNKYHYKIISLKITS